MTGKLMWKVAPHARASTTRDGLAILDVKRGSVLSANTIGARIWRLVDEGCDLAGITSALCAETGAREDVIERDVHEFLASLLVRGLIEPLDQGRK